MRMEEHFALPVKPSDWEFEGMTKPDQDKAAAHAINCHDELVATLEIFKCECTDRCAIHQWMSADDAMCVRKRARAILAKAKGE